MNGVGGFAAAILRQGVVIIDALLPDMQAQVTHTPWIGDDGSGNDIFGTPVLRDCFVDKTRKQIYSKSGKLITTLATLLFTEPIPDTPANPNQQRVNPVDPRDIFTLDDGSTAPIVQAGGFEDPGFLTPFVNEVILGVAR